MFPPPSPKYVPGMSEVPDRRCAQALPAAIGTPPPTMALVPSAPASNHCRCMEPPRPEQYPCASPRISASVRCSTSCVSGVTSCRRSSAPLVTWGRALARNWWCPRCEPLTASVERSPTIEPTAPPSCPMLECAGPCTSPAPARSRTVSSNARTRCSCPSIAASSPGSAAFQSAAVVLSSFHSAPGATRLTRGIGLSLHPTDAVTLLPECIHFNPRTRPIVSTDGESSRDGQHSPDQSRSQSSRTVHAPAPPPSRALSAGRRRATPAPIPAAHYPRNQKRKQVRPSRC